MVPNNLNSQNCLARTWLCVRASRLPRSSEREPTVHPPANLVERAGEDRAAVAETRAATGKFCERAGPASDHFDFLEEQRSHGWSDHPTHLLAKCIRYPHGACHERFSLLLEALGNPHNQLPVILEGQTLSRRSLPPVSRPTGTLLGRTLHERAYRRGWSSHLSRRLC